MKRGYPPEEVEPGWNYGKPAKRRIPIPKDAGPDTMLRLAVAARIAFPDGSMSVGALRRAGAAGRLRTYRLAGKDFTTLADIQNMREAASSCQDQAKALNSIFATPSDPVERGDGSSSTEHHPASESNKALAHLKVIAQRLKKPLPNTSPQNTSQISAVVIPLKS